MISDFYEYFFLIFVWDIKFGDYWVDLVCISLNRLIEIWYMIFIILCLEYMSKVCWFVVNY